MPGPWEKYATKPWEKYAAAEAPITDLPAMEVKGTAAPEDQEWGRFFPSTPRAGILEVARVNRPELEGVPDAVLAAAIRRQFYPSINAVDFYRQTGLADKLGYTDAIREPDPTEGMSTFDRVRAGFGRAYTQLGQGLKQRATQAAAAVTGSQVLKDSAATQAKAEDDRRKIDAPLLRTGGGIAGTMLGVGSQFLVPGTVMRGAGLGSAFLPRTFLGNVGQGMAVGAVQPTGEGESWVSNAAIGGGLSGVGYGAMAVPGLLARGAARLSPSVTAAMQERQAAKVIQQFAADPQRLANIQANQLVPGSMPTLAEATGDMGLAGLERTLANLPDFGPQLAMRRGANNTARVAAIEGAFNGADPAVATAIRQQANKRAGRMLSPVQDVPLETTQPLKDAIDKLLVKNRAKPAAREALGFIRSELDNVQTVGDAHGLRQTIGELMGGKLEGKANGKLAQFQLSTVRNLLDRQMKQAYPEWGDFLKGHRAMMKEADQVQVGAGLLASGRAVPDAVNDPVLTPAAFARAANKTVASKTRGDRLMMAALTDQQRGTIEAVRQDLSRQFRAMNDGRAVGSNTVQNAIGGNTLQSAVGPVGAAAVEPTMGVAMLAINQLRKTYGERTMAVVQDVMLNPESAADLMARLPSKRRKAVMSAIQQLPRVAASLGTTSGPLLQAH